jgi:hypothetical protein
VLKHVGCTPDEGAFAEPSWVYAGRSGGKAEQSGVIAEPRPAIAVPQRVTAVPQSPAKQI